MNKKSDRKYLWVTRNYISGDFLVQQNNFSLRFVNVQESMCHFDTQHVKGHPEFNRFGIQTLLNNVWKCTISLVITMSFYCYRFDLIFLSFFFYFSFSSPPFFQAFHFYLLAQRQLYEGRSDAALRTVG